MTARAIVAAFVAGALLLAGAAIDARAQAYPARPLKLVVPYPPGGSADILARVIGQKLSDQIGQPVVVENKPGAGTAIGAEYVAHAKADGYTLLLGTVSSHAMNPALSANLSYDPIRDFAPIAALATIPFVMDLNPSVPAQTVKEFVDYAKSRPEKIFYSSTGNGTSNHLAGELFNLTAGINLVHVPYKGSAPALQDLVAGQVQVMFDLVSTSLPMIKAEKVRPIAVTSAARIPSLPDVPTLKESGYPDYEVTAWFGLFAPAGTPEAVVTRLNEEAAKTIASAEIKEKLVSLGMETMSGSPKSFARLNVDELDRWRRVVKSASIKAD